ncbi:MAG: hypothetical protein E7207_03425 [Clostridium butyricum]|nr:hypothetical protein [Clostridium butyricum]
MNLFEMFADETKEFEEEQKAIAESNNKKSQAESSKKSNNKDSKNKGKTKIEKIDPDKKVMDEIVKYPKIVVKAYGNEIMHIEGESEVKVIKLNELADKLINEFAYQEFSEGISGHFVPNSDKTVGYLVATGKSSIQKANFLEGGKRYDMRIVADSYNGFNIISKPKGNNPNNSKSENSNYNSNNVQNNNDFNMSSNFDFNSTYDNQNGNSDFVSEFAANLNDYSFN